MLAKSMGGTSGVTFDVMDTNHDGVIDRSEFRRGLEKIHNQDSGMAG